MNACKSKKRIDLKIGLLLLPALSIAAGCTMTLNPDKFRQNLAQYAMQQGNKALFMNTQSMNMYWTWNRDTPQEAIDAAQANCIADAGRYGSDPSNCVPVAINDKQIYDPIPGALAAKQEQDNLNSQLMSLMPSLTNFHR
jgi:hypothetical protein